RAAGSAVANSVDKGKRPSRLPPSSKIPNNAIRNSTGAFRLLKALFDFYVDAESSVLIPQPHNGDVPVHVVLHLNNLLLRRAHIRNVSDGEVARNLLLDGNARRRALLGARRTYSGKARINT